MAKNQTYDSSWDRHGNEEAFKAKQAEWEGREWASWLSENLGFPFYAERMQSIEDVEARGLIYDKDDFFGYGHSMKVLAIKEEDPTQGIIVKAREGRRVDNVPLLELRVTPRKNKNYWPVREYQVWRSSSQ